jgi:methyl-accepting chemotaxis protein
MLSRIANIRIGTKLGAISAIAILMVAMLTGDQLWGNAKVKSALGEAKKQQHMAHSVVLVKAAERRMQISIRDIRLAPNQPAMDRAIENLDNATAQAQKYLSTIRQNSDSDNLARVQKLAELIGNYNAGGKELAKIRIPAMGLLSKGTSDVLAQVAEINARAEQFARDKTLPMVGQIEQLADEIDEIASQEAEKDAAFAYAEMASAEFAGIVIAIVAVIILIGAAIFGVLGIARPLGRMASVLGELTQDRLVDVPFASRGDEIGDIAKATEVFKNSIAEKVINLRVRSALDVVRSNVMVADDNYNIMYMNGSLTQMMREAEADLRKVLPSFDSSKLVGTNMDVFHKNPAHQRAMLEKLTGTHEARITIGNLKFFLVATAVIDGRGQRAGTVVEWRNETVEKAIESEVNDLVQAAVAGDFSRRVPLEGKKDFMLNLATAMNGLCETVANVMNDLIRMFGALAEGDFRQRITSDYQGSFGQLKNDANTMADRISSTLAELKAATREVTNAAAEISTSTTDLSQRTEEQAASLEETSASMEEMSATVKKNAENAQVANQSAGATQDVADRGGQVVAKAVEAMARIEESSSKISDIIGVIDEIARQTNLLALNAAVEAARAGEAGRGFAVVASEVRSLAQRSSQAAKDIKDLITNSNSQVKDGVELVNRAGTALNEIVESIKKVTSIVSDIASASAEQSSGIDQINKALTQMDEVTQQNSALVEENAATAKTLERQAAVMDERVGFFRIDNAAGGSVAHAAPAPAPVAAVRHDAPAARPAAAAKRASGGSRGPVGQMHSTLATAFKSDPEWKEF